MVINKDKAVNEIIDGYDAAGVPDNLVADRLDSAAYSLASVIDDDGATVLIAGATNNGAASLTASTAYEAIVDLKVKMDKANVPNDGKRYILVKPDLMALILKDTTHFINASALGDKVVETGAVGKIAGFLVIEWNDNTANLQAIAGHPKFATRANEWQVPVKLQDLSGSGNFIGASAVQGRMVYAHKTLRSVAIQALYTPSATSVSAAQGSTTGKTAITATATGANTLAYKVNPASRIAYGTTSSDYAGTSLTSGSASQVAVSVGDIIEVAEFGSDGCVSVAYVEATSAIIK